MKSGLKHILPGVMLFVGLVVLLHAILPHDHHYDTDTHIHRKDYHKNGKHNDKPLHCYYLNHYLVHNSVKTPAGHSILTKKVSKFFSAGNDFNIDIKIFKASLYADFYFPVYIAFLENFLTRGPPAGH